MTDFVSALAKDLSKSKSKDTRKYNKVLQMHARVRQIQLQLGSVSHEEEESLHNEMRVLNADIEKKTKQLEQVGMPFDIPPSVEVRPASPPQNANGTTNGVAGLGAEGGSGEYEAEEDVFVNPLQKGRVVAQLSEVDET